MMRKAGLIYREIDCHLDHLIPFCSITRVPLYITSKKLFDTAALQYKDIEIIYKTKEEISNAIITQYDAIISTLPRQLLEPIFSWEQAILQKKITSFWLPHGTSDKQNMDILTKDDYLLAYGKKMIDMLPEEMNEKILKVGNFRMQYYKRHLKFYRNLIKEIFPEIDKKNNLLYAPSWESKKISNWIESLVNNKPNNINLFIKLHPNTYIQGTGIAIEEAYKNDQSVIFIKNFYPIYAILSNMSYLITDISSIGYDFLCFDKPLFFTSNNNEPLQKCGHQINCKNPYQYINIDNHEKQRGAMLKKAFFDPTFHIKKINEM